MVALQPGEAVVLEIARQPRRDQSVEGRPVRRIEGEVGRLLAGCSARVRRALADRAGDLLIEADAGDAVAALREGTEVRPAECSRPGRAGVPEIAAPVGAQRC